MTGVIPLYLGWLLMATSCASFILIFRKSLFSYLKQLARPTVDDFAVLEDTRHHKRQGLLLAFLLSAFAWTIVRLPLPMVLLGFLLLSFLIPKILALRTRKAMLDAFDASLADGLTSLVSSLRAGLTLQAALQVAGKSTAPAFARQAEKVIMDYRLGIHIDEALKQVRQRVPTQNCNMAFGALIIGKQLGGPLPEILARIASTIRERQRVEGRLRALTAQGRGQAALVCSLPVFVGLGTAWLAPERMDLMLETLPGQVMLALVVILELLGIVLARKVLQLDI